MSKHSKRIECLKSWLTTVPDWQKTRHAREAKEIDKTKNSNGGSGLKK